MIPNTFTQRGVPPVSLDSGSGSGDKSAMCVSGSVARGCQDFHDGIRLANSSDLYYFRYSFWPW
jgi:hypothetical protein